MAGTLDIAKPASNSAKPGATPESAPGRPHRRRLVASPAGWVVWGAVIFFLVNLLGIVSSVLVNSFGTRWFDTWFPQGATTRWYSQAWDEFGLFPVIIVTLEV